MTEHPMNASMIDRWVKYLGFTYEELVAEGLPMNSLPVPLWTDGWNEDLIQYPTPGIELWYSATTRRLERIAITLTEPFSEEPVYAGELPEPFSHRMDQYSIRALLGELYQSKGPAKLPPPIGITGGWDAYRLGQTLHPNAEVAIQYWKDKSVAGLAFCLINKAHD